jgi:hypothetical protein
VKKIRAVKTLAGIFLSALRSSALLIGIALAFAAAAVMRIYEDSGAAAKAISQFDFGRSLTRMKINKIVA